MNRKFLLLGVVLSIITVSSFAQIREIPQAVRETFANQYPNATNTDYRDQIVTVYVDFEQNGEKFVATYNNKGDWKGTEKDWNFNDLDGTVKEGFEKSKFADWDVTETKVMYLPGGSEQYRVRVKKNDVQKKYLYFNTKGRLLREAITI